MPFNIGSRCSNKKYWKLMFDLIISSYVVPKSTVKHTHSAQMEIVIVCSWNSLNPHSVHGNCQTCDPLGLEVACSCKETQTRVSSLAHCCYICFTVLLALGCFSVCGCCCPPYSRLPCICTGILEKREQEYILELYIAVNALAYFSDPRCLVNS